MLIVQLHRIVAMRDGWMTDAARSGSFCLSAAAGLLLHAIPGHFAQQYRHAAGIGYTRKYKSCADERAEEVKPR